METMKLYVETVQMILIYSLLFFSGVKCSVVLDSLDQEGILYSDYCPKAEHCEEGAHVMCMYYDPKRKYGPRCHDPHNVTVTEEIAITILEITNAIRSKAAQGLETGKDNVKLPKAYGMMRLNWDSELAAFAQVSVDRCHLRHDLCRATKRFPNPAQMASLVRFQYPSWKYLHLEDSTEGLTHEKVLYAVKRPLRNFFLSKNQVVPDMITRSPNYEQNSRLAAARAYLDMVHAPNTHVGCALSGYVEFLIFPDNDTVTENYYNVVAMICNFSSRPTPGRAVYNTTPPAGYTVRCGCPPDTVEDEDCLCNEKQKDDHRNGFICDKNRNNCKPPVFILPIITMEDAPPSMLQKSSKHRLKNITHMSHSAVQVIKSGSKDVFQLPETQKAFRKSHINQVLDEIIHGVHHHSTIGHPININPVKNHYYMKKSTSLKVRQPHLPKPSIFSRSSIFELPVKVKNSNPFNATMKNAIKNILPRKNFTYAKNLVNSYMNKSKTSCHKTNSNIWQGHSVKSEMTTNSYLNKTEKIINNNSYLMDFNNREHSTRYDENITSHNEDQKLLSLLDKLEQEIRHIELLGDKKELIDAKIRKIYDTVTGKSEAILFEPNRPEIDISHNYLQHNSGHKYGPSLKQNPRVIGNYESKYNSNYDRQSSLEYIMEYERNKFNNLDINDQEIENGHRKDKLLNYNDYDLRSVPSDKLLYSPSPLKNHHHHNNIRKYHGDLEHGIHYLRKNKRPIYNLEYDEYESKAWNNKYKNERHPEQKPGILIHSDEENRMTNEELQDNGLLNSDRKKYYQNKLEDLDKKISNSRTRYQKINERQIRPIKIPRTNNEVPSRPSKSPLTSLYIQDRARVLHGF